MLVSLYTYFFGEAHLQHLAESNVKIVGKSNQSAKGTEMTDSMKADLCLLGFAHAFVRAGISSSSLVILLYIVFWYPKSLSIWSSHSLLSASGLLQFRHVLV